MDLAEFLTEYPPGSKQAVEADYRSSGGEGRQIVLPSPIQLHCEKCDGVRRFDFQQGTSRTRARRGISLSAPGMRLPERIVEERLSEVWARNSWEEAEIAIADYRCRDCGMYRKQFAIALWLEEDELRALKIGEFPPFGKRLPKRLLGLMSEANRDLMLKGKSDLNAGRGLGAFAYYRRVVEAEKDAVFDAAIETARQRDDVTEEELEKLERARDDFRFSRSIEELGDFFPEHLKIDGQNPLALLHSAMSKDIHAGTDEDCLDAARAVELLLGTYVESMADRRDEAQAKREAVKLLRDRRSEDR